MLEGDRCIREVQVPGWVELQLPEPSLSSVTRQGLANHVGHHPAADTGEHVMVARVHSGRPVLRIPELPNGGGRLQCVVHHETPAKVVCLLRTTSKARSLLFTRERTGRRNLVPMMPAVMRVRSLPTKWLRKLATTVS